MSEAEHSVRLNVVVTPEAIVNDIGISNGSVFSILNDHLCLRKAMHKMGAAFPHNLPQTPSCENFEEVFGVVQPRSGRIFSTFRSCRQNLASPQYNGDQAAVGTESFSG